MHILEFFSNQILDKVWHTLFLSTKTLVFNHSPSHWYLYHIPLFLGHVGAPLVQQVFDKIFKEKRKWLRPSLESKLVLDLPPTRNSLSAQPEQHHHHVWTHLPCSTFPNTQRTHTQSANSNTTPQRPSTSSTSLTRRITMFASHGHTIRPEPDQWNQNTFACPRARNGSTPLTQARLRQLARNKAKPVTPASPIASMPGGPPSLVPVRSIPP